jgi:hypothetical protein
MVSMGFSVARMQEREGESGKGIGGLTLARVGQLPVLQINLFLRSFPFDQAIFGSFSV